MMTGIQCPICDAVDIVFFLEIAQAPAHCNLLWSTREEAVRAPRGEIHLSFCQNCGHIFNPAFQPQLMEYSQDYENSLFVSPRFQKYSMELVGNLIARHDLHGKQILEIGSGQGDFLQLLCELGGNRGIGFDPSYVPAPNKNTTSQRITFIQDFYSSKYRDYEADFICCRHVLEHLPQPREILKTINHSIGNRDGATVFFEVPNVMFTLGDLGIWDIIYEHPSYFSAPSLTWLFSTSGFLVSNVYTAYNNQFLCIEARLDTSGGKSSLGSREDASDLSNATKAFSDKYRNEVERWRQVLGTAAEEGKQVIIWGAGSKGVTFLNALEIYDSIEYVVDINPRKQGKFIAGTGQQIVSPLFLREYKPDVILVMNSIYENEIRALVRDLDLSPDFLNAC
jgi:SAM-dependent methyltransferase